MDKTEFPKIFISYSWSSEEKVLELAKRLCSDGVDVVLDKWDLKEGNDKYVFMEQCVTDPEIKKVLIICDKVYAEKANTRKGGVGDETVIISSEVYGKAKQEKFIPIVFESDENGIAYKPAYLQSRIHIDLSTDDLVKYEAEYEKLLRDIHDKPLYRKPPIGKKPDWLDEEKTSLSPLTNLIQRIKGAVVLKKQQDAVLKFADTYIETLKTFRLKDNTDAKAIYEQYIATKCARDLFLDFLSVLFETELDTVDVLCEMFERMHNTLTCEYGYNSSACQARSRDYEIFHILIWELFICTIVYLRYRKKYDVIYGMVSNTYFLTNGSLDNNPKAGNYCQFQYYSQIIEEEYKPTTENRNKYTLLGHTLCNDREKLPIYSKESIAEADIFLYQICNAYELEQSQNQWRDLYWFPRCYVYARKGPEEWAKMKSRRFCKKIYDLFGVTNLEELKNAVSKCTFDPQMKYSGFANPIPAILSEISLEEIGSLN